MGTAKLPASKSGSSKKRTHKGRDSVISNNLTNDERFSAAEWDPTFSRVPKKARRAVKDERFTSQLKSNPGFRKSQTPVDRFGKPKKSVLEKSMQDVVDAEDESQESESEDEIQPNPDVSHPSSDLEDDDSANSELEEFMEINEAPDEEEIPRGKSTNRLAVIGLDWSSIRAVDIYASLNSFCPPGKQLEFVEVHPSKFGLERLAVEAKLGPQVVSKEDLEVAAKAKILKSERDEDEEIESDEDDDDNEGINSDDEDQEEKKWRRQVALRKYEEERLKYYYGIVKFEDIKSADAVYEQCDGVEYGQSGRMFDLRFIPDDMIIETAPRDRADKLPQNYIPPNVNPSTLNNSTVKLSWDADDPDRVILKKRTVGKKEIDEENLKAYLASSSDEDEKPSAAEIDKKRSLLLGPDPDDDDDEEKEEDMGVEVTFDPGLLEKGEEIIKRKQEREDRKDETPWEARMRRQQERKAEKKKNRKLAGQDDDENDENDQNVDLGFKDPFFLTEGESNKKSRKSKKELQSKVDSEDALDKDKSSREEANLELLMMADKIKKKSENKSTREALARAESDEEEDRTQRRKQKRTRGRRRDQMKNTDTIEEKKPSVMDTNDTRFEGLFKSHLFAMDPTHPKYKENETTQKILQEKARRAKTDPTGAKRSSTLSEKGSDKKIEKISTKKGQEKSELQQLASQLKARAKNNNKRK